MSPFRQNAAPSRRIFLLFCAVLLLLPTILQRKPSPKIHRRTTSRRTTPSMNSASHARWRQALHRVYVPKDASHAYPFLINRTPYGMIRTARIATANRWAQRKLRARWIHLRVSGCPRALSLRRRFLEVTPHKENKKSAKDVDESTDATTPLNGCCTMSQQQRKAASSGFPTTVLHRREHHQFASRAESRVAASAGHRPLHGR